MNANKTDSGPTLATAIQTLRDAGYRVENFSPRSYNIWSPEGGKLDGQFAPATLITKARFVAKFEAKK